MAHDAIERETDRRDGSTRLPIAPDSQLRRGVSAVATVANTPLIAVPSVRHGRDRTNGDERRQKRVLDQVLAIFLTNETSEQILHY